MSILNVDEISNPDIRLNETSVEPIVQIFREAMFVRWTSNEHIWPGWALQIRYGSWSRDPNGKQEDPIHMFHKSTKMLESCIADRICLFRIDDIDGQLKHLILSMFDDVSVNMRQQALGTTYFIYNRKTDSMVMQVCFVNLEL